MKGLLQVIAHSLAEGNLGVRPGKGSPPMDIERLGNLTAIRIPLSSKFSTH
jgi:hypothetical protein